jgi:hypothetical protein
MIPDLLTRAQMREKIAFESDDAPTWMMLPHVKKECYSEPHVKQEFVPRGEISDDHGNMNIYLAASGTTDKPVSLPGHRDRLAKNPRSFFKAGSKGKGSMTRFAEERLGIEQCLYADVHGPPTHPFRTAKDFNTSKPKPMRCAHNVTSLLAVLTYFLDRCVA